MLPRTHGATRGRTLRRLSLCCRAVIHAAAQFYVRPRIGPLLPRSSPYFRALLRAAAHPWCHARQNASTFYVLPRIYTCFVSSPMLPRSGLDWYKRAVSSTDNVDHPSSPSSSSPHHRHHYHHHHAYINGEDRGGENTQLRQRASENPTHQFSPMGFLMG